MIFVILVGILMLLMVGILVAVGRIVYKDAKALGMNAALWTLLAVCLPNFVGVIIYLVVRSNTPKVVKCSKCQAQVKENYNVCPECGSQFTAFCEHCRKPVEIGMKCCPYCGEDATVLEMPTVKKLSVGTSIGKSLGITLAVFFGTMLLILGSMVVVGFVTNGEGFSPNISIMNTETNFNNHFKNKFGYRDGKVRVKFKFDETSERQIQGSILVEEGQIALVIEDETGNVVRNEVFEARIEPYAISYELGKGEGSVYQAFIKYTEAKGGIELQGR
ncbi:MAG: zinc ribbon domain-containing protein [Cellulosilyticaceae bacterium]